MLVSADYLRIDREAIFAGLVLERRLAATQPIFGAVPTGSAAYTLARQMGGDAPLMATIVTIQTGLSFLTLPLTLTIAQGALGT